jgi:hypothetical protein
VQGVRSAEPAQAIHSPGQHVQLSPPPAPPPPQTKLPTHPPAAAILPLLRDAVHGRWHGHDSRHAAAAAAARQRQRRLRPQQPAAAQPQPCRRQLSDRQAGLLRAPRRLQGLVQLEGPRVPGIQRLGQRAQPVAAVAQGGPRSAAQHRHWHAAAGKAVRQHAGAVRALHAVSQRGAAGAEGQLHGSCRLVVCQRVGARQPRAGQQQRVLETVARRPICSDGGQECRGVGPVWHDGRALASGLSAGGGRGRGRDRASKGQKVAHVEHACHVHARVGDRTRASQPMQHPGSMRCHPPQLPASCQGRRRAPAPSGKNSEARPCQSRRLLLLHRLWLVALWLRFRLPKGNPVAPSAGMGGRGRGRGGG